MFGFLTYLRHIAGASKHKCKRTYGLGHQTQGNFISAIPHRLDGLTDVSVVVCHANVLSCKR